MDGKICRSKVSAGDAILEACLEEGIEWDFVRWEVGLVLFYYLCCFVTFVVCLQVEAAYPWFPKFLQKARQALSLLQADDSDFQLLLDISNEAEKLQKLDKLDWRDVKKSVMQGRAAAAVEQVGVMADFCRIYGAHQDSVKELAMWGAKYCPVGRKISLSTFDNLSSGMKVSREKDLCPMLAFATLKGQATGD